MEVVPVCNARSSPPGAPKEWVVRIAYRIPKTPEHEAALNRHIAELIIFDTNYCQSIAEFHEIKGPMLAFLINFISSSIKQDHFTEGENQFAIFKYAVEENEERLPLQFDQNMPEYCEYEEIDECNQSVNYWDPRRLTNAHRTVGNAVNTLLSPYSDVKNMSNYPNNWNARNPSSINDAFEQANTYQAFQQHPTQQRLSLYYSQMQPLPHPIHQIENMAMQQPRPPIMTHLSHTVQPRTPSMVPVISHSMPVVPQHQQNQLHQHQQQPQLYNPLIPLGDSQEVSRHSEENDETMMSRRTRRAPVKNSPQPRPARHRTAAKAPRSKKNVEGDDVAISKARNRRKAVAVSPNMEERAEQQRDEQQGVHTRTRRRAVIKSHDSSPNPSQQSGSAELLLEDVHEPQSVEMVDQSLEYPISTDPIRPNMQSSQSSSHIAPIEPQTPPEPSTTVDVIMNNVLETSDQPGPGNQ
ncbi:unnamed protein product [Caenorhabditis bovis]|uniref:Uncharacterized protein n=1 Tax=Caenorhabditis bovis TaxID=2654633 RepID=A0A8S1F3H1_9PELO|nr:unnamed protein product [Caenorhabditis bovis]